MRYFSLCLTALLFVTQARSPLLVNQRLQPHGAARYAEVANWPQANGKRPPRYGSGQVMCAAVAPNGNVYVLQRTTPPVLVFDSAGRYLSSWGRGLFAAPHAIRFNVDGTLWITDTSDQTVTHLTADGKVLKTLGVRGVAGHDRSHFDGVSDIAFGPHGDIYIADGYKNSRVVHLTASGKFVGAWGHRGSKPGEFHLVHSIAVDSAGSVYVADRENGRVQVFAPDGRYRRSLRNVGHPFGLWLLADGRLVICDGYTDRVGIYNLAGDRLISIGPGPGAAVRFRRPHLVCADPSGAIYVAEVDGRRVRKFVSIP